MLAYGIVTFDRGAPTWAVASVVLFALPLALQGTRWVMVRAYALWFAAFLVLQALLTPWLRGDFITLPPLMNTTIDVRATDLPGGLVEARVLRTHQWIERDGTRLEPLEADTRPRTLSARAS